MDTIDTKLALLIAGFIFGPLVSMGLTLLVAGWRARDATAAITNDISKLQTDMTKSVSELHTAMTAHLTSTKEIVMAEINGNNLKSVETLAIIKAELDGQRATLAEHSTRFDANRHSHSELWAANRAVDKRVIHLELTRRT